VNGHVEQAKMQLAQVEEAIVDVLGGDLLLDEVIGNLLARLVMAAEALELAGRPAPVLKHLAGRLDKVPHG
jgi:hypothetical protein